MLFNSSEEKFSLLLATKPIRMIILTLGVKNFHSLTLRPCKNGNYYMVVA